MKNYICFGRIKAQKGRQKIIFFKALLTISHMVKAFFCKVLWKHMQSTLSFIRITFIGMSCNKVLEFPYLKDSSHHNMSNCKGSTNFYYVSFSLHAIIICRICTIVEAIRTQSFAKKNIMTNNYFRTYMWTYLHWHDLYMLCEK